MRYIICLIITDYAWAGVTRNNMNKCVVISRDTETLIYSSIFTSLYYRTLGYGIISPSCYANYFLHSFKNLAYIDRLESSQEGGMCDM